MDDQKQNPVEGATPTDEQTHADDISSPARLEYVPIGRQGKIQLIVHIAGGEPFTDKLDVADAEGRAKLLKQLFEKHPQLKPADVEPELNRIAAEVVQLRDTSSGSSDEEADVDDGPGGGDCAILIGIAKRDAELFRAGSRHDGEAYATIRVGEYRETWPIKALGFAHWLRYRFFAFCDRPPTSEALTNAINMIASLALYEGTEQQVFTRFAEHEGAYWLDLANEHWQAVRVTAQGWEIVESNNVPVRFVRRRGMLPHPTPVRGGTIDALRAFVNCPLEALWILFVGALIACFRPRGPYPVIIAGGEQGSAKSTLVKKARLLLDPNKAAVRRLPREDRDLMIAAQNSFVLAYDNLSTIPPSISDALCSIATGGGYGARQLYSDDEEKLFDAARPILLNGIEDVATRPDLLDRAVLLSLPPITEQRRREEKELDAEFEAARPGILGALLDAMSTGLRRQDAVRLKRKPRMIDVVRWVTAAEVSFGWKEGTFLDAFMANRGDAHAIAMEASAIGQTVIAFMDTQTECVLTPKDLLAALDRIADTKTKERKDWPGTPKGLSDALKRLAPTLRALGIDVTIGERKPGGNRDRQITLRRIEPSPDPSGGTDASPDDTGSRRDRDAGDDDNRPYQNGSGRAPEGSRDGWDGWDAGVGTQSNQQTNFESDGSRDGWDGRVGRTSAASTNEIAAADVDKVATQPSQASQPSHPPSGGTADAVFPGRKRDGSTHESRSADEGRVRPDDRWARDIAARENWHARDMGPEQTEFFDNREVDL
jgi:hypothetical protein